MSEIVSVVSGEADESDSDGELSSANNSNDGGSTNSETTDSASAGGGTSDGLRPSRLPRMRPARTLSAQPGIIVKGEASETDSDEESNVKPQRSVSDPIRHDGLPPLRIELSQQKQESQHLIKNGVAPPHKDVSRFDTLLHRKLKERNGSLQMNVYEAVAGVFRSSAKDLTEANQMLGKSQTVIQDVCHNLRVFTNDLKEIELKLDAINTCSNIPPISMDARQETYTMT